MSTATAMPCETAWLRRRNYQLAALNTKLAARLPELKRALESGLCAYPDHTREEFYDVELPSGWAYIHVRDEKQTVYLVAHSSC